MLCCIVPRRINAEVDDTPFKVIKISGLLIWEEGDWEARHKTQLFPLYSSSTWPRKVVIITLNTHFGWKRAPIDTWDPPLPLQSWREQAQKTQALRYNIRVTQKSLGNCKRKNYRMWEVKERMVRGLDTAAHSQGGSGHNGSIKKTWRQGRVDKIIKGNRKRLQFRQIIPTDRRKILVISFVSGTDREDQTASHDGEHLTSSADTTGLRGQVLPLLSNWPVSHQVCSEGDH